MKTVSKIDDSIFGETEKILTKIKVPRNRYINEALEHYNKLQRRQILEKKLKKDSDLVKAESIRILKDFEEIDFRALGWDAKIEESIDAKIEELEMYDNE